MPKYLHIRKSRLAGFKADNEKGVFDTSSVFFEMSADHTDTCSSFFS
jgi:hypothetical protein